MQKALGMLPGLGAGKAAPGRRGRGGAAGGMAMLTAVAGLAYRNRDKIAGLMSRRKGGEPGRRQPTQ